MKSTKPTNTSNKAKKTPKVATAPIKPFREEYYTDMFSLREMPVSEEYIQKFALEWITVAMNDETMLTINNYPLKKGMQIRTVQRWCERSPVLKKTYEHIINILGDRREVGALTKRLDSTVFLRSQHMFDPSWAASEEWRANLAAKVAGAGSGITLVEMERFPSSDKVPVRVAVASMAPEPEKEQE